LSIAIANLAATLDPEVIVLSGAVSRAADLLIEPILGHVEGLVPFVPELVASPLERRAVIMGAIMLVLNLTAGYFAVKKLP
jgi:predicted NBD/HSP70 family sugar kinase